MKSKIRSKFIFDKLLFLAPMEGISNHIYRECIVKNNPVDVVCTEFVRLSGDQFNPRQIKDKIQQPRDAILSVQLMGDNPKLFAASIPYFQEIGVRIIDLNLGCPSARVNRKNCGAAMLLDWKLLSEVLASMRKACQVSLSCKMRAGWDTSSQAVEIAQIIESEGVDFLTVHPRTRMQAYDGIANRSVIAEIKTRLKIPVIANGDIVSVFDAKTMLDETKADGIMMGRGVLQDPYLLKRIHAFLKDETLLHIDWHDYCRFYSNYIEASLNESMSSMSILNKIKEHFRYFSKKIETGDLFFSEVKKMTNLNDLSQFLNDFQGKIKQNYDTIST